MNKSRKLLYVLMVVALLVVSAGYLNIKSSDDRKENVRGTEQFQKTTRTISIGTVGENAVRLIKTFQPTADYIAAKLSDNETGYEGKVIVVKTMDNITELLKEQKLDLCIESPFPTVMIVNKSGAVPFLRRWKDGVAQYHSVFIVKENSSINKLEDFVGKTIAFEDPGSTSAYLLPKAYLLQKGFNVSQSAGKDNISYVFTGEDENTVLRVIEGKADMGAISNTQYDNLPESMKDKLKVIDRTVDVPRHVVSHRSELDPALVEKIKQILLDMDKDREGIEIMKNFQKTAKYDEISNKEIFSNISDMIKLLE